MCVSRKSNSFIQPLGWCSTALHPLLCCQTLPSKSLLQENEKKSGKKCRSLLWIAKRGKWRKTCNVINDIVIPVIDKKKGTWYWLSRALQGTLIQGKSDRTGITAFNSSAFGHSMTLSVGPRCWSLVHPKKNILH